MTSQLEYWATIGKAAEENPDLPFSFIKETLLAMEDEFSLMMGEE